MRLEIWFDRVRENHMYSECCTSSENKLVATYYTVESHDYSPAVPAVVTHVQRNYSCLQIDFIVQVFFLFLHERMLILEDCNIDCLLANGWSSG
ncbi:hypothetical protein AMTRI_Chr01g127670 [Amborella trichopoda]